MQDHLKRLLERLKDPKERKFFAALLGGKILGLAVCFTVIFCATAYFKTSKAHAQAATPAPAAADATPAPAAPAAPGAEAPAATPAATGGGSGGHPGGSG